MRLNEGVRVQEVAVCLLCGTKGEPLYHGLRDGLFDAPGIWDFLRCPQCDLVWLNPRPIDKDVSSLYRNYHTHAVDEQRSGLASMWETIKRAVFDAFFVRHEVSGESIQLLIGKALILLPPVREVVAASAMFLGEMQPGRLLDVGAGSGRFLSQMRDLGWEVIGVEPDIDAARIANERFSVPVVVGTLHGANLPDDSFDAVTVNHVIEHVPDPIHLLQDCRRVLKPAGKLVVVTPNIESLGHHLLKESWRGLEVPRHLCLFSWQGLKLCAQLTRLNIETLRTTARSARWMWASSRMIHHHGKLSRSEADWRLRTEGWIFQLVEEAGKILWKNAGEELILVATKH